MNVTQLRTWARQALPAPLQHALSRLAGTGCQLLTHFYLPRLKRRCASQAYDALRAQRLQQLRAKETISVIFHIPSLAKWKADSLLKLMAKHPRFAPALRVVGCRHGNPADIERRVHEIQRYAAEAGVPCLDFASYETLPAGCTADIVFVDCAYDSFNLLSPENRGLGKRNLCYIPYGFFSVGNDTTMNQVTNNAALFNFYENEATRALAASLMLNKGKNVRIVGHTMADAFLGPEARTEQVWKDCGKPMKKVIWAPHWTIIPDGNWLTCGNFLQLADSMVKLAQQHHDDIQFAFKPHPGLYPKLCSLPDWGKERTDAYYKLWAEMPNTQLAEGSYAPLFMQSDAIVHDSSSFIVEYLFADRPGMFLRKGEGWQGYSPMAEEGLKCYHIGLTEDEVETFLQQSVLRGEDPYAEIRAAFRKTYLIPPHGVSAAQNVVNCLLGEGAYAE